MDYLTALIINIIGNLVMPWVQKAIAATRRVVERFRFASSSGPTPPPLPITDEQRAENRKWLRRQFEKASIQANCLLVLAGVLWFPFAIKAFPGRIFGSSPARFDVGLHEIAGPVLASPLLVCMLGTLILYLPMMFLSRALAGVLARGLSRFYDVQERRADALVALVFLMLTAVLGCHLVYALFAGLSYISAVVAPLLIISVLLTANLGSSHERAH